MHMHAREISLSAFEPSTRLREHQLPVDHMAAQDPIRIPVMIIRAHRHDRMAPAASQGARTGLPRSCIVRSRLRLRLGPRGKCRGRSACARLGVLGWSLGVRPTCQAQMLSSRLWGFIETLYEASHVSLMRFRKNILLLALTTTWPRRSGVMAQWQGRSEIRCRCAGVYA